MFNINTAKEGDQVLVSIKGQKVTAIITKIEPHTINWDLTKVFITTDEPVKVWNDTDIRTEFCITHDIKGNDNRVSQILA